MKIKSVFFMAVLCCSFTDAFNQGDYWFQKGVHATDVNDKIKYFTLSLEKEGKDPATYFNLGLCKLATDLESSKKDLTSAIKIDPDYTQAYMLRGIAEFALEDFQAAYDDFTKVIELAPESFPEAYVFRGQILLEQKFDFFSAEKDFNSALGINPSLAGAYAGLAKTCMFNCVLQASIGDSIGARNLKDQMFEYYLKAIELEPGNSKYYKNRGIAYSLFGGTTEAIDDFTAAIRLDPNDIDNYKRRGDTYRDIDSLDEAIEDYGKCLEIYPEWASGYELIGDIYYSQDNSRKAEENYLKSIEISPDESSCYLELGLIYYGQHEYGKAIDITRSGLKLTPEDIQLLDNLGSYYLEVEAYKEAIDNFDKCLSLDKINVDAKIGMTLAYYESGNKKEAKRYYDEVIILKPCLKKGMEGITELEKEGLFFSEKKKGILSTIILEFKSQE